MNVLIKNLLNNLLITGVQKLIELFKQKLNNKKMKKQNEVVKNDLIESTNRDYDMFVDAFMSSVKEKYNGHVASEHIAPLFESIFANLKNEVVDKLVDL